jgi:hypothetical protein
MSDSRISATARTNSAGNFAYTAVRLDEPVSVRELQDHVASLIRGEASLG